MIDHALRLRPDWHLPVIKTVRHLPPMEAPDTDATTVGDWITAQGSQ